MHNLTNTCDNRYHPPDDRYVVALLKLHVNHQAWSEVAEIQNTRKENRMRNKKSVYANL